MESKKFITPDIWKLAINKQSPDILEILLPNILPSCLYDCDAAVELALLACDANLFSGLLAVDKKSVMESARRHILKPGFVCPNVGTAGLLLKNGVDPDELFNLELVFSEDGREEIGFLLKNGLWPMERFTDRNSPRFREIKDVQKRRPDSANLVEFFDLCLLLFGILFFPQHKRWLYDWYQSEEKPSAAEFEERVDFVSNERIYNYVRKTLKSLIRDSLGPLDHLEQMLECDYHYLLEIYTYKVCKDIPVLSPADLAIAEKENQDLLQMLGAFDIPTGLYKKTELIYLIEDGDNEGIDEYLEQNCLTPSELEKAINASFLHGNSEITLVLMNHTLKPSDPQQRNKRIRTA